MDEQRKRMEWLCRRIQEEPDQGKFTQLVSELNELLARAEEDRRRFAMKVDPEPAGPTGGADS
jgi:hypothetical protein